jgi:hypothetical protein
MRRSISLHAGTPDGQVLAQLAPYATACRWADNEHGARDLSVTVPRRLIDAFRLYGAQGLLWVVASAGGRPDWVGLLDESSLWADADASGITLRALGRWSALDDLSYTALWSDSSVAEWQPTLFRSTDMFAMDTQNRLFIGLKKGATYAASFGSIGSMYYDTPRAGLRNVVTMTFDYAMLMPVGFFLAVNGYANAGYDFTGSAIVYGLLAATGVLQTGTGTITAGSYNQLEVYTGNSSGAPITFAGEDGANYVRLTNIRLKTTTTAAVYADEVVADVAAKVAALNPGILTSATPIATSPGLDLTDLVCEDAKLTDVLNQLALWGDGAGTVYQAGVDIDGYLTFQPRGSGGRTWYVDVGDLEISSDRGDMANSVYALYQETGGRTLRTGAATDTTSVARYGRTRQGAVKADTTSATQAGKIRDVTLSDRAIAKGAARFTVRAVSVASGGHADPSNIRPGDTLIVRNMPLLGGEAELDQLRAFRVGETGYDPIKRAVTLAPEARLPRLEVLLGQQR